MFVEVPVTWRGLCRIWRWKKVMKNIAFVANIASFCSLDLVFVIHKTLKRLLLALKKSLIIHYYIAFFLLKSLCYVLWFLHITLQYLVIYALTYFRLKHFLKTAYLINCYYWIFDCFDVLTFQLDLTEALNSGNCKCNLNDNICRYNGKEFEYGKGKFHLH